MDAQHDGGSAETEALKAWLRNDRIPALARAQVTGLMKARLIDTKAFGLAAEICAYAGKPERALPFLTAMHYLGTQGVAVGDTYRMAREHGRRVGVEWSAKRWKDEHTRLSRLSTLKRLAAQSVRYDVEEFAKMLPERFPGYLIETSRRLGMEGLRQDHCVASYGDGIAQGEYAIASVFVDGQRWTVQLALRGSGEDAYLQATQIRGRHNRIPSTQQANAIKHALGIADRNADRQVVVDAVENLDLHDNEDLMRTLYRAMRECGIVSARTDFDGSGDSGSVDAVEIAEVAGVSRSEAERRAQAYMIDIPVRSQEWDEQTRSWIVQVTPERRPLLEALSQVAEAWVDGRDVNWYDGDGGFGHVEFKAADASFEGEIHVRYSESTLEASDEIPIDMEPWDPEAEEQDEDEDEDAAESSVAAAGMG